MTTNPVYDRIQERLRLDGRRTPWLAKAAGVSIHVFKNLSRRPNAKLTGEDALKTAAALDVSVEWLLYGEERDDEVIRLRQDISQELDQLSVEELRALAAGLKLSPAKTDQRH